MLQRSVECEVVWMSGSWESCKEQYWRPSNQATGPFRTGTFWMGTAAVLEFLFPMYEIFSSRYSYFTSICNRQIRPCEWKLLFYSVCVCLPRYNLLENVQQRLHEGRIYCTTVILDCSSFTCIISASNKLATEFTIWNYFRLAVNVVVGNVRLT